MNKKGIGTDVLSAVKYGAVIATVCSVLLFAGGYLFGGFTIYKAVEVLKSGMCIISGLSLFVVAGLILTKKGSKVKDTSNWRKKFAVLNYGSVIGIIALILIAFAAVSDALLFVL